MLEKGIISRILSVNRRNAFRINISQVGHSVHILDIFIINFILCVWIFFVIDIIHSYEISSGSFSCGSESYYNPFGVSYSTIT